MKVVVYDNNVEKAMKVLKRKLVREGVFKEVRLRAHYEKPSEKRARKRSEAERRARKLAKRQQQRS